MMRSLWTGVTGLQSHQQKMDVIGNNIANVNTVGFKKSEVTFEDLISQTTEIAHGPSEGRGGTNAQQIGLGVQIGAITEVHTQGQIQYTGKNTDLAISGDGFFIANSGNTGDNYYTRNGSFNLDSEGYMVYSNGYKIQGWESAADPVSGKIVVNSSTDPIGDIQIKVGDTIPANETNNIVFTGNLNSLNSLAIEPITVEYTQNNVSRDVELRFEHAHPTLNYYTYKAYWKENPPNGAEVGDAVNDYATGQQVQGIMLLDDNGRVIGNYKNTDLATSVNSVLKENLWDLDDNSTIKLTGVDAVDQSTAKAGMYRIRFEDAGDLTHYQLYYSSDYDYNNPSAATWQNIPNDAVADSNTTQNESFGSVGIKLDAADWRGVSILNDTLYFEVAAGNANGILDLPSEIPDAKDDHPMFQASKPVGRVGNTGTGALAAVNIDDNEHQAGATDPDIAGTPNYTFRQWRARVTAVVGTTVTYAVEWADYASPWDPTAGGITWTSLGNGTYDSGTAADTDFSNAANGIYIPEENWSGTPAVGDIYDFRVNYSKSPSFDRDFFTIKEDQVQYNNDAAPGGANAGTGALSTVDVESTAPADNWTITFTGATTYNISGAATGVIGTAESTAATFEALGISIQSSYWSGVPVAGDTFTFSTVSNVILTDVVVPSGNTQAESITFLPNTTDTTMNTADAGNPVTGTVNDVSDYQYATSVDSYDSLGAAHTLTYFFERKDTNKWMWSVMDPTPADPNNVELAGYGILAFNEDGTYDSANSITYESPVGLGMASRPSNLQQVIYDPDEDGGAPPPNEGAGMVDINLDFTDLVQYAAENDGEVFSQDGYGKGTLSSFTVNTLGYITGLYDNGQTQDIGRVAIASFNNPAGLIKQGDSLYRVSGNSGVPRTGVPGLAGRGTISAGSLEMSNVDLSEEFTNMIVTQRGFQANSRSITTADQMLQELLTLKR